MGKELGEWLPPAEDNGAIWSLVTHFITSFTKKILPALSSAVCKVSSVQGGPPPVTPPPTGVGDSAIQVTEEALSHSFLSLESPVPHQVTFHSSAHILEVTKLTNGRPGQSLGLGPTFPLWLLSVAQQHRRHLEAL